jgi:hypothetical protein
LSPSELDHLDPSHRARTRMQHAAARSTRQRRPLFTPLPARAVSWPPLDTAGAPSPAYKKPPFLPEKMHAITRDLPDILSSSLSPYFELAGNVVLAGHRVFPAFQCFPRRCTCWRWPRRTTAAALHPRRRSPSPPVSLPVTATLPGSLSLLSQSRQEEGPRPLDQFLTQRPRFSRTPSLFKSTDRPAPPVS